MRDMNVNNKVIYSTLILISSLGAASADTPAPQSYKSNGNFQPVTLVSSVNAKGKVAVTSYKGGDGNWHDTTPIAQICSVDSTGSPLLCPPYIDGQTVVNNLLNKASGIAGLDASGNLVAPLSTTGEIHGGMVAQAYYPQTNLTIPATNAISTGDNLGYHILDDRSVLLGGRSYADSAPTFIYAAPYGGSSLGSTLAVAMTKRGVGGEQVAMAPLGTDGGGGISSYPEMDATATWFFAHGTKPWVEAGQDIANSDNVARTVTYDSTHAYFAPALPAQELALLRVGMHVMTNSIGSTRAASTHYLQPNNDYAGEISSISPDGSSITVGGWRVLGAGNTVATQVPSVVGPFDMNTWPGYTHPDIFMGTYTHAIVNNSMCFLEKRENQNAGDYNSPEGNQFGSPANDCEIEEADIGSQLPDYEGRAKGILVTYNGPNKPSLDSYDFMAAGGTPNGYVAWNGSQANNFLSDGFYAHAPNGVNSGIDSSTNYVIANAGDTREMAEFIGSSAVQPNGDGSGDKISLVAFESLIQGTQNMGANPSSNVAVHWSYLANGTTTDVSQMIGGQTVTKGNRKGDIVFNADGAGGIGIYGANQDSGVLVQAAGNVSLQNAGAQVILTPSSGSDKPFIYAADGTNLNVANSVGSGVVINSYGFSGSVIKANAYFQEVLSTPASSSAACNAGQFTDDAEYHYVCVAQNSWKRVALSSW
ncbi:hypothetical protein WH240_03030 [Gluconobacter wancherniae]|uniref:hypothetical protein n=1 Tax=Gluconobacter wancherniae TaxID=1307955 RepID=UPI00309D3E70